MNTIILDRSFCDVLELVVNGDFQAKLVSGEESWNRPLNKSFQDSRESLLRKMAEAKIPHRFVEDGTHKIMVIG